MSTVVMERLYAEPVTEEQLAEMVDATETCLGINGATRLCSYASADRTRFVCIFQGPDLDAVRRSVESAGLVYQKLWVADVL